MYEKTNQQINKKDISKDLSCLVSGQSEILGKDHFTINYNIKPDNDNLTLKYYHNNISIIISRVL